MRKVKYDVCFFLAGYPRVWCFLRFCIVPRFVCCLCGKKKWDSAFSVKKGFPSYCRECFQRREFCEIGYRFV
jgi:hypothetical protein